MAAVRQIVLEAMNSSRTAALSGGSIVAVDGLFAAFTSRGLLPVCCAAAPGGPGVPVLSAATVLLPNFSAAISASRAARSVAGSGGPCFGSRISLTSLGSGTLIVVGLAGATVCADLSDSYLLSGSKDAVERSQDGLDRHDTSQDWEEELASREGRLQELMERQLDEIKTHREDLAQRERKFDEESAKKQAHFDEERKAVDNGKRLLDDDRRKFHQERYEFGGGRKDKKDGKFTIFLKQLGFFFGMPGKIIDLKRKAEDFEVLNQGFAMWYSVSLSLLLAGKFGEFFKAVHRSVKEGARERLGLGSPGELPTFCPRCGLELPKLKPCSPCAANGGVAKAPAGVAPQARSS